MSYLSATLLDLLSAGYHNNRGAVTFELHNGASPNFVHPNYGVSAMHLASGQGEEPTQLMLLHGGDPNVASSDGLTPLHVAASWGDRKTLQFLLQNGADINIQDQDGNTARDLAEEEEHVECAQLLRYFTMTQKVKDCRTPSRLVGQQRSDILNGRNCCQNNACVHGKSEYLPCHINVPTNVFEVPSQMHLDTITERIYKYLGEGKQICFDATSPDTPVLGIKSSEAAYAGSHDCTHHEPRHHHKVHRTHCSSMLNTSSPESPSCSCRDSSRGCINLIHSHCCSGYSTDGKVTARNVKSISHQHYEGHTFGSENCDQLCCVHLSPHSYRDIPGQSVNCFRPQVFCGFYRTPSGSEFCNHLRYNTRSTSPNNTCSSFGVNTSSIKSQRSLFSDTNVKSPTHQSRKNLEDTSINSQSGLNACIASKDLGNQKGSTYTNGRVLPLSETRSDMHRVCNTGFPSRTLKPEYDKQDNENKIQNNSNPKFHIALKYSSGSSVIDGSSKKIFQNEIAAHSENCKDDLIKSGQVSGIINTGGKLFPSLQKFSDETLCAGSNNNPAFEVKDDWSINVKNRMKKLKRKSLLKPPETVALLPKTQINSHERVAEFILSVQNLMSDWSFEDYNDSIVDNLSPIATRSEEDTRFSDYQKQRRMCCTEQSTAEQHNRSVERTSINISNSSIDTYATCDEGYSDAMTNVNELPQIDKESKSRETIPARESSEATSGGRHFERNKTEAHSSKWKSPTLILCDDDIMTSDDSYIRKTNPRVYRMKLKPKITDKGDRALFKPNLDHSAAAKQEKHINIETIPAKQSRETIEATSGEKKVKRDNNQVEKFPVKKRLSTDSLFSTVSVREYVVRDTENNITLIERHIPSDCGSSIARRSFDSTGSRETIDSQATLIYDWYALNAVLKARKLKPQTHSSRVSNNSHCIKDIHTSVQFDIPCAQTHVSCLGNTNYDESSSETIQHSNESTADDEENTAYIAVPAHLEKMTCQEISQELQKYGEIPGPVIPATRQAYLRRLTTLESTPGLVTLSRTSPDYPNEMRQALNGQFDVSGLVELESKMVEVFNTTKNNGHWREGTVKSSFTYLLLDPRITDNLPLRSKNMSDLEVFKTFICSIFYIGKGKRSRPYCHLYDAVSKMNKVTVKMSAKEKQIVDIWNAGLGVVSLHCFQSVIPVEAYTREACMIQAVGLHKLTNMKHGDLYGAATSWNATQRRKLGVYLLKKALQIFLAEGERQICLPDLKSNYSPTPTC